MTKLTHSLLAAAMAFAPHIARATVIQPGHPPPDTAIHYTLSGVTTTVFNNTSEAVAGQFVYDPTTNLLYSAVFFVGPLFEPDCINDFGPGFPQQVISQCFSPVSGQLRLSLANPLSFAVDPITLVQLITFAALDVITDTAPTGEVVPAGIDPIPEPANSFVLLVMALGFLGFATWYRKAPRHA